MTLQEQQNAFAQDFASLIGWIHLHTQFTVSIGEVFRTPEMEAIYVKEGKSETMNSMHLLKLAGDINIFLNGGIISDKPTLAPVVNYWKSLNPLNTWGGDFTTLYDYDHFQRNHIQ